MLTKISRKINLTQENRDAEQRDLHHQNNRIMNKILAVYNGTHYSKSTTEYGIALAREYNAKLIGAFVHDMRYVNYQYAFVYDQPFVDVSLIDEVKVKEKKAIHANIRLFEQQCKDAGVKHKVHLDRGIPVQEILKESVFCDLILVDSGTGFFSFGEEKPGPFLKDVLVESHCPVLIVPEKYREIKRNIIAYDGTSSGIYALKQFSYIFPKHAEMRTTVVSVNEDKSNHIKHGEQIKDLIAERYADPEYVVLNGKPETELMKYLERNDAGSVVVMGSYGRGALSRFIRQSMANEVILEYRIPVFIAHR